MAIARNRCCKHLSRLHQRLEVEFRFETPKWMGIDEIHLVKPRYRAGGTPE
jgi:hypothetical protein